MVAKYYAIDTASSKPPAANQGADGPPGSPLNANHSRRLQTLSSPGRSLACGGAHIERQHGRSCHSMLACGCIEFIQLEGGASGSCSSGGLPMQLERAADKQRALLGAHDANASQLARAPADSHRRCVIVNLNHRKPISSRHSCSRKWRSFGHWELSVGSVGFERASGG